MQCHNCGHEEVHFYHSSNVNGEITETLLCAECAEKLGFSADSLFAQAAEADAMSGAGLFDPHGLANLTGPFALKDLFCLPGSSGLPGLSGLIDQFFGLAPPRRPNAAARALTAPTAAPPAPAETRAMPDPDLSRRREINILRERMRAAAEAEDFEAAAALRDEIYALENR